MAEVTPSLTFPTLYRRYLGSVLRAVRRVGVPARHCEDIAQEVFLAVHKALPAYDRNRKIEPWLMTIAYRKALDHLRRAENREQPSEAVDELESTRGDEAERLATAREAERLFDELVQTLDPDRRVVFLMAEIDDLRLSDIAQALALPEGTVASRLARARDDFAAAAQRRRVAQERRPTAAQAAPLALFDAAMLLEVGRTAPPLSVESVARQWGRLQRALTGSAWAGGAAQLAVLTPAAMAGVVLGSLGVGAAAGAGAVYAALRRTDTTIVATSEATAFGGSATPPAGDNALALRPSAVAAPDPGLPGGPPAATGGGVQPAVDRGPAAERAERAILENARAAMQRGDSGAALRALARHAAQFPSGIYKEEREALRARLRAAGTEGKP